MVRFTESKEGEEEPIYERLQDKECLIISRDREGVLIACNEDGEVKLERVPYPEE